MSGPINEEAARQSLEAHSRIVGVATLIVDGRFDQILRYLQDYTPEELRLMVVCATGQWASIVERLCEGVDGFDGSPQDYFAEYGYTIARRRQLWEQR